MKAKVIKIKKYANRRLYDTDRSAYVTLDEVAEMIRSGSQVQVFDAKTKEDVTAFILTQVVLEKAKNNHFLLPVPLLHLIIQYGDGVMRDFFDKYLEQTFKSYLAYKGTVDTQFQNWLKMGVDFTEMAGKTLRGMSPFQPPPEKEPNGKDPE